MKRDASVDAWPDPHGPPWPSSAATSASALAAPWVDQMAADWREGSRTPAEAFLGLDPALGGRAEVAVRLIYEEICLREEYGPPATLTEVQARFPHWGAEVGVLFACHRALVPCLAGPSFPTVGDEVGGFSLAEELGRGALGRVFRATELCLAGRAVVLKVTPIRGGEHFALARLQHAHIVPLLSAHDLPDRGLRLLCMPDLGGTTLDRLFPRLAHLPASRRTGRDMLDAMGHESAGGPARDFLGRETWTRAICWVASCLADALHHAHLRGLVHLDVKPSNVLIAGDGMPMLLDFHLARALLRAGVTAPDGLGGTPAYMSPEQAEGMAAVRAFGPLPAAIDARADVHALGVLLYHSLAGSLPPPGTDAARRRALRRANREVSAGLARVVSKCLAPEPNRRYADAAALADDLRRHLDHRPLRGVADWGPAERWTKWRQRSPHSLTRAGAGAVAVLGTLALAIAVSLTAGRRLDEAAGALDRGRRQLEAGADAEAIRALEQGIHVVDSAWPPLTLLPAGSAVRASLVDRLDRARQSRLVADLHALTERARLFLGPDLPGPAEARSLQAGLAALWSSRGTLSERHLTGMTSEARRQLCNDLVDLSVLRARLLVHLSDEPGRGAARREALAALKDVEEMCGSKAIIERERQGLAASLGLKDEVRAAAARAAGFHPGTPWEFYALGRSQLVAGELDAAARSLGRAAELQPGGLWPQFYRGQCALRRGQYAEALDAFGASVALAPGVAACRYNRGLAYLRLGEPALARRDFEGARRLDPTATFP